ncbi:MAG: DUF4294 domain-containing protein, partial [Prevotella sp.]
MKRKLIIVICLLLGLCQVTVRAQNDSDRPGHINPEDMKVDMKNPTFEPRVRVGKVKFGGDSIQYVELNPVYVFSPPAFDSPQEWAAYNRLVYNVKKVLPIAEEVNTIVIETYEYLQTLPNKKARDA